MTEIKKKPKEPNNIGEKKVIRDKNGRFIKGVVTNPSGKPPGTKNYLTLFEEALEKQAKEEGVSYWDKLAKWSFRNPSVAVSMVKKFIPDKTSTEITAPEGIEFIITRDK
jgi:hypothetical protein